MFADTSRMVPSASSRNALGHSNSVRATNRSPGAESTNARAAQSAGTTAGATTSRSASKSGPERQHSIQGGEAGPLEPQRMRAGRQLLTVHRPLASQLTIDVDARPPTGEAENEYGGRGAARRCGRPRGSWLPEPKLATHRSIARHWCN